MSSYFLITHCFTKSSHRSRLLTTVERPVFVACVIMTTLVQQTSPAANFTPQVLQLNTIPIRGKKRMFFPSGEESHLRILYKRFSQAGTKALSRAVSLAVPHGKFISLTFSPIELSAPCESTMATLLAILLNRNSIIRPCTDDSFVVHRDTSRLERPHKRVVKYHSDKNSAICHFNTREQTVSFGLTVTISALDVNRRENLAVTYQTSISGIVTPYGFGGFTDYALGMDARCKIHPPPGHSIMVSFPHVDIMESNWCYTDSLDISVGGVWTWNRCGYFQTPPEIYRAHLKIRFVSRLHSKGHSGFKTRFSFHSESEKPNKINTTILNTAVFNCSVHFYIKFKQHLQCNLDTECDNAQDEATCPYSRGSCGPGFLMAGSKCYKYIKLGYQRMTWYDASAVCLNQGMTMASFPTLKEERAFRDTILQSGFTTSHLFFGLRTSDPTVPSMYREVWQWSSGIMAYYVNIEEELLFKPSCAALNRMSTAKMSIKICGDYLSMHYMFCEEKRHLMFNKSGKINITPKETLSTFGEKRSTRFVSCAGHKMHDFLSCDHMSRCGAELGVALCVTYESVKTDITEQRIEVLMFVCNSQTQTIHYTQACDYLAQCFDSSDETFCIHQTCSEKQCHNLQCVTYAQWCDGMAHCTDGSDEDCPQILTRSDRPSISLTSGFHAVFFDGYGKYKYIPRGDKLSVCPETHFLCANRELCIPVFLRCNGVYDCWDQEDEDNCGDVTCPGYYRCLRSAICVHSDHVCDGLFQCPQQDDELLCELVCPDSCLCQGLAFVCPEHFPMQNFSELRSLDASGSGLTPDLILHNKYLAKLALSTCRLQTLPVLAFPNMKFLDLSNNILTKLNMYVFLKLSNLKFLNLSGNPIKHLAVVEKHTILENFHSLDLSYTALMSFESDKLWNIHNLKILNLSHSMLTEISSSGFASLTQIEFLDLIGTDLNEYPFEMLKSLYSLQEIYSDDYKLCCRDVLPQQFNVQNCHTSPNEIASCKDLLRSIIYRMFLWVSCCLALIGNTGSFVTKIYLQRDKPSNSFNIFISNLHIADFLMGIYLAVVGSADQIYKGTYLWHDELWKKSAGCQIAGFLSLLSCEMSAFIICLITLDRYLVMRFPFSQVHFRKQSACVVCALSWAVGVALAIVPLLPMTSDWEFYSQTGICIPLPVTRKQFKGHFYSFGILIVFNFFLFVFIAVGQLFIYLSIQRNSMATNKKTERESTVARRLLTIVMSDFLCWFPIGLLGLLASTGFPIPGEVNVAMAIFTLPLNSALNPFLYTFNLLLEKRRKASEERLLKLLQSRISS